jgi:hypothetical protein
MAGPFSIQKHAPHGSEARSCDHYCLTVVAAVQIPIARFLEIGIRGHEGTLEIDLALEDVTCNP